MRHLTIRWLVSLLAAVTGVSVRGEGAGQAVPVDLELVIAVDVSQSMDEEEFRVQRTGYIEAIRHRDFLRAVTSGSEGRIALTYLEWSGSLYQKVVVPWRLIDGAEAARSFAAALQEQPPEIGHGTSISSAIAFAATLFKANDYDGAREVIDISGDGPNNYGPPVREVRDRLVASGIVINGLPILIRPSPIVPDILRYYADCVTGGPGSFVLPVRRVEEFAEAIRRKLVLEVAGRPLVAVAVPVAAEAPSDCLVGERARERLTDPFYPGLDK